MQSYLYSLKGVLTKKSNAYLQMESLFRCVEEIFRERLSDVEEANLQSGNFRMNGGISRKKTALHARQLRPRIPKCFDFVNFLSQSY